ncbi:unnamed protein product [Closterium sp. NIES-65]|nr:unnamed protein product [Closterium sp. NIES-65]
MASAVASSLSVNHAVAAAVCGGENRRSLAASPRASLRLSAPLRASPLPLAPSKCRPLRAPLPSRRPTVCAAAAAPAAVADGGLLTRVAVAAYSALVPAGTAASMGLTELTVVLALRETIIALATAAIFFNAPKICRLVNYVWGTLIMRDDEVTEEEFQDSMFGALVGPLQFVLISFFLTRQSVASYSPPPHLSLSSSPPLTLLFPTSHSPPHLSLSSSTSHSPPHFSLSSPLLTLLPTSHSPPHSSLSSPPLTLLPTSHSPPHLSLSSPPLTLLPTSHSPPHLSLSSPPLTLLPTSHSPPHFSISSRLSRCSILCHSPCQSPYPFFLRLLVPLLKLPVTAAMVGKARLVAWVAAATWFATGWKDRVLKLVAASHPEDKPVLANVSKLLTLLLRVAAVGTLAEMMGFSLKSLIAVGGISGVAIGFASKEIVTNFFGGLILFLTQPFVVGDKIKAGSVTGRVREIGFLQTKLEADDNSPIVVPNYIFNTAVVTNYSRAGCLALEATFVLRNEDIIRIRPITEKLTAYLRAHPLVDVTKGPTLGYLKKLSGTGLEVGIIAYVQDMEDDEYLAVQQEILEQSVEIIVEEGAYLGESAPFEPSVSLAA